MKTVTSVAVAFLLAACGMSRTASMSQADIAAYDQAAAGTGGAVATYRAAAETASSPAECASAVARYDAQVRPMLDRMKEMAGRMDQHMTGMGSHAGADMQCGMDVMVEELEHHLAVACTLPDVAADRAEAERHCDTMQAFVDHMRMRADEMGSMMGDEGMHGQGTGSGIMGGGWTMPDGGMMGWDHTIPGCNPTSTAAQVDGASPTGDATPTGVGMPTDGGSATPMDGGMATDGGMGGMHH